eukprot:280723_1
MSNKRTIHRCTQQYVVIVWLVIIVFVMLMFHDIWYLSRNGVLQHTSESFPDQRQSLSITVKSSNKKNINIALSLFSHHYKHCFYLDYIRDEKENGFTSRICQLPNNVTINISRKLSTMHPRSAIYLTHIYDESQQYYDLFLMKYRHHKCTQLQTEYTILKTLYSDNITKINIPSVHSTIPFYYYTKRKHHGKTCFFFLEYMENTNTLPQFMISQTQQSLNTIDGGVIPFILNCYDDVMNVVHRIYDQLDGFHNDFHERNILVDVNTHKCLLIDFEDLFYLNDIIDVSCQNGDGHALPLRCIPSYQMKHDIRWMLTFLI